MTSDLWIEAGSTSGGSRNQVEFDEDLAAHLGLLVPDLGQSLTVQVSVEGGRWLPCAFAAKRTTYGVLIYRLSLPTVTRGGVEYPGTVIRFTPVTDKFLRVRVVEHGSADHQSWVAASEANGSLSRTTGADSREYGLLAT